MKLIPTVFVASLAAYVAVLVGTLVLPGYGMAVVLLSLAEKASLLVLLLTGGLLAIRLLVRYVIEVIKEEY